MSQFYVNSMSSGNLPPQVPTSFVTDNGTAVPAANILIVHGTDSTQNLAAGVIAKGGVVGTGVGNEVDVVITNRIRGTGNTTGVGITTVDLYTFPLGATPGAYNFESKIVGYNASGPNATGFTIIGTVRTTGASGTLVSIPDETFIDDIALVAADVDMVISGNNLIIRCTGINGLSINWNVLTTYIFVS